MLINKKVVIGIIIIVIAIVGFSVFSSGNAYKKIKDLTNQVENTADSLQEIHLRYDALLSNYQNVVKQLENTQKNLTTFKDDVAAISGANITTVVRVNNSLRKILEEQDSLQKIVKSDTTNLFFR